MHLSRPRRKVLVMQRYRLALIVLLSGVLALAGWYGWMFRGAPASEATDHTALAAASSTVSLDGKIVKDAPSLKPGVWYLAFEEEGKELGVELFFDQSSVCSYLEKSGRCKPEVFVNGRAASLEGEITHGVVRVSNLTFTEAVKR